MEPDMLVQMIMHVKNKGIDINEIAGDDDTTGFDRLKKIYPESKMIKTSDRNHVKKNVIKKLYAIKSQHKQLSDMVMNSILKNFSFMIDQNKGDVEGMENGLKAIVEHMYGDHAHCNRSWCGFLKEGDKYKHSNLPHGKDLTSDSLRSDLEKIFLGNESVNPRKLASLSSSQANENFNNMLAAKAPKAKHYSSSASLGYRVDSSILQKNEGYAYVSEVHASMGLSPGEETIKRSSKINMKRKKTKEKAKTKEAKRRRFFLKQTRTSKTASKEIREGKTYESEIGLKSEVPDKESQEIPEIQDIIKIPLNEQEVIKAPVVVFDLETTGLSKCKINV
ncbi:uncharacterized protein LOC143043225 [Mytilus galloprovincialis]|uniref:uncharacterized protein LOC143043225 n=1 Tax=Mytilus galloprovincialis TaxID=29158 RepID=UPI003F7C429A